MAPRNETNGGISRTPGSSMAMSVIPTDTVQDVADSLGLPNLRESVASVLAADVEYRLRQVVQDASKFMRHGKRTQLRVADIDRALRQRNIEPIFGFHPTTLGKASISGAHPTPAGSTFKRVQTSSGPIHLVADEEIDLEKVLSVKHKIALSPGVGWSAHWLAIEGVQPAIPQNPSTVSQHGGVLANGTTSTTSTSNATVGGSVQPGGVSAVLPSTSTIGKPGQPIAKPLIKHVLSRELQLYFERLTTSILTPPSEADVIIKTDKSQTNEDGDISMLSPREQGTARDSTPNTGTGNTVRDAALASLKGDAGLHQLVPYLIQWINEKIQGNIRDQDLLDVMLATIDALISNPFLGIEPYLHQLLPYLLSILLIAAPAESTKSSKAYLLRSQSASIIRRIVLQHGETYTTLRPRIVRTILSALNAGCARAEAVANGNIELQKQDSIDGPRESAATKLGAIIGLRALGAGCLRALLVRDEQADQSASSVLLRLGFWCLAMIKVDENERNAVNAITEEVLTAFAEVQSTFRGNVAYDQASETLKGSEEARLRLGDFWIEKFISASDAEASRGILALLAELQPQ